MGYLNKTNLNFRSLVSHQTLFWELARPSAFLYICFLVSKIVKFYSDDIRGFGVSKCFLECLTLRIVNSSMNFCDVVWGALDG